MPEQISEAAKSGDGTVQNVGIKLDGQFVSPVNNQRFSSQRALDLHLKSAPPALVPAGSESSAGECWGRLREVLGPRLARWPLVAFSGLARGR